MLRRPERILLFRSGRHLGVALAALSARSPACEVTVVTTPAGLVALDAASIPADRRIVYDRTPFFQPWPFLRSVGARHALWKRFDRVCVLWTHPSGVGHGNVDRTAMLVSPRGFTAITADGMLIERRTLSAVRHELVRASRSIVLLAGLGLLVWLPSHALRPFRRS